MRKIILAAAMSALIAAAACTTRTTPTSSGQPNPPFEGEPPQDAYVSRCEPGRYGGEMVLELFADPTSFNVTFAADEHTTYVLWYHVHRCLVDYNNADAQYDPGLCTKYETSPDGREWTFYLRKGIRWSDGEPFTADDVLFTYAVAIDENIKDSSIRDIFREGRDANDKSIYPQLEKIDDHTVRFRLSKPNADFLDVIFNLYLIPKHKWEKSWKEGKFSEQMGVSANPSDVVGLGPFRLKEYTAGERVVLERNPHFWKVDSRGNRLPYLDRLKFIIAKDFNTIQAKFQAGELDVMSRMRATDFASIRAMESEKIKVTDLGATVDTRWMVLNQNPGTDSRGKPLVEPWKLKLFRNQKFRQAVSYAIDREGLANTVFVGRAEPLYSFVTPADKTWYSDDIQKYPFNPDLARQMFAEIGLKDTNGDGFLEDAEGHTVGFSINTNSNNEMRVQASAFIAENLKAVGIKATSVPLPSNIMIQKLQSNHEFEAVVFGWVGGVPPGPSNVKNTVLSSGLFHVNHPLQKTPATEWEARLDELMHKIEETIDQAERKRMYAEVQRIWSEQLPEINLVCEKEGVAYKNLFGNLRPSPMRPRLTWNAEEIYIK
jgi:peptide/nickel transport system substrate-binding protein